jgi:polysaccharide chain length determinant protein (PEP-CTERM system associated)
VLPGRKFTPEDILRIVLRRKWLILLPLVAVSAATVVFTSGLPDEYRSETTILVVPQRVPESYVRSTVTTRIEDRLQSLKQQINSRSLIERTIEALKLPVDYSKPAAMEVAVERLRAHIDVSPVRGDAFTISFVSRDPQLAKAVTEQLTSFFIEENKRDRSALADGTSDFLQGALDDARSRLIAQEKKLEAYRLEHAGELPSQASTNLQALQSGSLQLQALGDAINRDQDRQVLLEQQLADLVGSQAGVPLAPTVMPDPGRATSDPAAAPPLAPIDDLAQTRARLRAAETRLTEDHPDVKALHARVAQLEAQIARAPKPSSPTPVPVPVIRSAAELLRERRAGEIRTELDGLKRRIASKQEQQQRLRDETAQYQARLEAVPIRESELAELTRDHQTLSQIYNTLLVKKEDANIAADLERRQVGEQFRVLDPALVPERPFSPNRLKLNAMGVVLGLLLGVGMAGALEFLNATLKTEEDIRSVLALPVIATIPVLAAPSAMGSLRAKFAWIVGAAAAATGVLAWVFRP